MKGLAAMVFIYLCVVANAALPQDVTPEIVERVKKIYPVITSGVPEITPEKRQEYIGMRKEAERRGVTLERNLVALIELPSAREELKRLGPSADRALLALITDLDFLDNNPLFFDQLARDDDLVVEALPIVRKIVHDYLAEPDLGPAPGEPGGSRFQLDGALGYLSVWGDASDIELMRKCHEKDPIRFPTINNLIDLFNKRQELRRQGKSIYYPFDLAGARRKFHECAYSNAEWDAMHPPPQSSPDKNTPDVTAPPVPQTTFHPKGPSDVRTETTIASSARSWLVWLAVVIAATGGAVWLLLRKSPK